ncbi:MAG: hypothetical protein EA398_02715 [Deltaproteobacteria bacterium]|nr:MAG: hypothetical protein EA398_02715 [Deltaproteobacteria bacterium]
MDFFEQQDAARRRSGRLVGLFLMAALLILVIIYLAVVVVAVQMGWAPHDGDSVRWLWQPDLFFTLLVGHTLIVGLGTWWKIRELSEGGAAVARMLGGRALTSADATREEKRLINVVEEMAIASGVPVPQVFVLDREWGFNAFAAGYGIDDAAIAVTRGGLRAWSRDELQGVIAHEFSHILNGDMRLNIRMMGVLNGLLVVATIGAMLLRFAANVITGERGTRQRDRNSGAIGFAFLVIGAVIYVAGWVGVFFGRVIRGAVSREREFLADASAVQFTRNPAGLAGALRKVGGASAGARVENVHAEEASHLFFGNALRQKTLGALLASHPPLDERIRRLDPSFDGRFEPVELDRNEVDDVLEGREDPATLNAAIQPVAGMAALPIAAAAAASTPDFYREPGAGARFSPTKTAAGLGAPAPAHLRYGGAVLDEIPLLIREASSTSAGAVSVIVAMLLARQEELRAEQLLLLSDAMDVPTVALVQSVDPHVKSLAPHLRLPAAELCFPALRNLSIEQRVSLLQTLDRLGVIEPQLTVFRFALRKLLRRRLLRPPGELGSVGFYAMRPLAPDLALLLSVLARVGHHGDRDALTAFELARSRLIALHNEPLSFVPEERCTFLALDRSLDRLSTAAPMLRRQIIDACIHCVLADHTVTVEEAELLRVLVELLGGALPPFLPALTEDQGSQAAG